MTTPESLDDALRTELEAAAFRRLLAHLAERGDVQNIDLMNLAGFCRNCLARWMQEAAAERGVTLSKDEARALYYGMGYEDWRAANQTPADEAKQAAFAKAFAENVGKP